MNRSSLNKQTEALKLALEALEKQVSMAGGWQSPAEATAITAIRKALAEQPAQQQEPWGWAIMHSDGTEACVRARVSNFFGVIQEREPFTAEDLRQADSEGAGLAPHRIVTLYTSPPARKPWLAQTVIDAARAAMDESFEAGNEQMDISIPAHLAAALSLCLDEYDREALASQPAQQEHVEHTSARRSGPHM